ncbi:MAG: zinc ribbon domain-containing protein [Anaerolineaceae bacterium]|nr:zinc ribbon domain-containing protein [Anaerolineaceae bacterium]
MPVYTYRCESCDIQFDRFQKFSEQALTRCPECGKKTLRKVFQPVGIVFKGSGFYSTDHRSPSGQSRYASAKSEEKSGESEKSSSSETAASEKATPDKKPKPEKATSPHTDGE